MGILSQICARFLYYPTLFWNIFLCRIIRNRNWWDDVDEHLVLGAIPFPGDVKKLNDIGITCVINLCAESDGPLSLYKKHGIQYFHIPTVDFCCPSVDSIDLGVSIINRYAEQKKKVYIHCKAGRGRSATIVFCWLVRYKNFSASQAMNYLISRRPQVNKKIDNRLQVKTYLKSV